MHNTPKNTPAKGKSRFARAGYTASLSAIVIALAVAINLVVSQLPQGVRELDLSPAGIYTVSDTSKEYLAGLADDIRLVILAEEGSVDSRISKFIDKYAALSSHITTEQIDPVKNPAALTEYDATANSIVVINTATNKRRVIPFMDIIKYDYSSYYYTGRVSESSFDAEGQLTGAIDYVTGEPSETVYLLAGHGESTLPSGANALLEKANIATESANLILTGAVPEDCSLLLCYAPASDLSSDELGLLREYLANGGQVMLFEGPDDPALPNWHTLLGEYGIESMDGYIADTQRYYPQSKSYYALLPEFGSTELTSGFGKNDLALMLNSHGYRQSTALRDTIQTAPILTTSDGGVAVIQDTQTEGRYWLGALATEETPNGTARLTVFGSSSLIDDSLTGQFANLANLSLFSQSVSAGFDSVSGIVIPEKSLAVTYNTISAGGLWGGLFTIVLPLSFLIGGFVIWSRRRKQ